MARCSSCYKMCALDMAEPEVEIDIDEDGTVTGTVRIVCTSQCCGDEVKEATFDVEVSPEGEHAAIIEHHIGKDRSESCELSVQDNGSENTERQEGKGRGLRTFRGACVQYEVTCACLKGDAAPLWEAEWSDEIQASSMDEIG